MPESILKLFGARVRDRRLKLGLTQEGLAERCGLHWTYIGGLERGEKNPTLETLWKISLGLSTGLGDLFERRSRPRHPDSSEKAQHYLAKLLQREDPQTVQMAMNVLRD